MTAVERNNSGNVVRSEIIRVDSEFRVVNAMNVEIPDQAMPNPKAIPKSSTSPRRAREAGEVCDLCERGREADEPHDRLNEREEEERRTPQGLLDPSPRDAPHLAEELARGHHIGLRRRAPHGVRRWGVTSSARILRPVYFMKTSSRVGCVNVSSAMSRWASLRARTICWTRAGASCAYTAIPPSTS